MRRTILLLSALLLAGVALFLVFFYVKPRFSTSSRPAALHNRISDPDPPTPSGTHGGEANQLAELSVTVRRCRTYQEARRGRDAMVQLLQIYNAAGKRADEITALCGPPSSQSDHWLDYRFDDGFGGRVWRFCLEQGRVKSIVVGNDEG